MAINTEKLGNILQELVSATAEVQGAAMVNSNGLPLALSLPGGLEHERALALSAAIVSIGKRLTKQLFTGEIDRIYVECEERFSILTSCGADAVFVVLADKEAKQGDLMLEIKHTLAELKLALI